MKLDCGLTRQEKIRLRIQRAYSRASKLEEWHTWFAWFPVRVGHRDCRWLERVERKITYTNIYQSINYYPTEYPRRLCTEYRAINE